MLKVDVEGLGTLEKDFEQLAEKLTRKKLVSILRPGATLISKAVKAKAPRDRGYLAKSIVVKAGRGKAKDPRATVFVKYKNNVPSKKKGKEGQLEAPYYAIMVHNGTIASAGRRSHRRRVPAATQGQTQRIKPNPFVYDAFEDAAEQVANKILADINSNL